MNKRATEEKNIRTSAIDEMTSYEMVKLMHQEDTAISAAVEKALPKIAEAADEIVARWNKGGRVFVIGAGTSGRVGMLDAVELGPTFSVEEDRWTAIVSGGNEAMWMPLEETEDDEHAIREELKSHSLAEQDCVIGITASGSTPFAVSGLDYAKQAGACAISISNNEHSVISKIADVAIELTTGPEVIRGSTRLKAGTSQKIALNMISTSVMIQLGKVYENEMADMKLINRKLKKRAELILAETTGIDEETAGLTMEKTQYNLKEAIFMTVTHASREEAGLYIHEAQGRLKQAIHRFFDNKNK
ncbi:N-acetylmuramic acid 6-phosphate etherase [Metabacillus indicus]|uniref:N-acetylmuramic acid 6-phosphate etherase n=1 Tax=Metabacillus indicus TaxID=246786 RepID=A0A084H2I8_METID|nr:N-acetylmuramic acid 6-phosphate etherase [Metabacillus indicus]KEZ53800.1 N-acetylmuramic acid-6-phosphate etherase [Metabacillus indicus]